jgi:hypothetical protein
MRKYLVEITLNDGSKFCDWIVVRDNATPEQAIASKYNRYRIKNIVIIDSKVF